MLQLKVGPQGIRGMVDQGLTLELVIDMTGAFATWLGDGPVVVARDTRPSSVMLFRAVQSALCAAGAEVLDAGICPTAVAQGEASRLQAAGLVSITASHNPATWNGLKLFGEGGRVLASGEGREILDLWHQGEFSRATHDALGAARDLEDVAERYLEGLIDSVDRDAVASAGLRVVVDVCNGAGAMMIHDLCRRLGVELVPISCEPSGEFPHPPDPTIDNMAQVAAIMRPVGAHVGFGLSSDCERVSMVTEDGEALGTGATLPLLAEELLSSGAADATIVASVANDSRVDRVAGRRGARVARCGVGIQAVAEQMNLTGAALGGEWSGGVARADWRVAFDGLAAMTWLLEGVARRGGSRALAETLPRIHSRTMDIPCPVSRAYSAVSLIRESAEGEVIDQDGVRVTLDDGWYYVRVSHTEPVVRVFCEASTSEATDSLLQSIHGRLRSAIQV